MNTTTEKSSFKLTYERNLPVLDRCWSCFQQVENFLNIDFRLSKDSPTYWVIVCENCLRDVYHVPIYTHMEEK